MKRSGFTMIELIFVIVILGILAAVAIPKLSATRDDAKIAKAASEVSTVLGDVGSYYTSKGAFDANISVMTNVDAITDLTAVSVTSGTAEYQDDAGNGCILFTIAGDGNLTLEAGADATASAVCNGVNGAVSALLKTHQYGGSNVSY